MNGEWIIVKPIDYFTGVPVYECSICKNLSSGYNPGNFCIYCNSKNTVNTKKSIRRPISEEFPDKKIKI